MALGELLTPSWSLRGDAMWRYLGAAVAVHAVWTGAFLALFTLTIPLDHPWWEAGPWAVVVVLGLCVQMSVLLVLGLLVMLWLERGLGGRASAQRFMDLACGLEFRRRWPWTVSWALLVVLGLCGGGALGVMFVFVSLFLLTGPVDRADMKLCPEGV